MESSLSVSESESERGYCLLEEGYHAEAMQAFEDSLRRNPELSSANFGAALTDAVMLIDVLYTTLWTLSSDQEGLFGQFPDWLVANLLGGAPESTGWLDRSIARLRKVQADETFTKNLKGIVIKINLLEGYLDFLEVDQGDAFALSAALNALKGVFAVLAAYDLDVPISYMLNPGEPIYTLFKLDVDGALNDKQYPSFLNLTSAGAEWMGVAQTAFIDASLDLAEAARVITGETDNQSQPDQPDYPDLFSAPTFTLRGHIFIPGIFGPAPLTAILQMLFQDDREGVVGLINEVFPGSPPEMPDALIHVMGTVAGTLRGEGPINVAGTEIFLNSFFEKPPNLRLLLQVAGQLGQVAPEVEQGIPCVSAKIENRADGNALPWEHPELYEPVPTLLEMETHRLRGVDGPAAEIHVGNGELMAGFTREGRLKNLFFPSTTSYNLVPYLTRVAHPYLETEPLPFMGANPEHGSFPGLRINGALTWPMRWLDHRKIDPGDPSKRRVVPRYEEADVPIARISYTPPSPSVVIDETAFVPRFDDQDRVNVLIRRFLIQNPTDTVQEISFIYYGAFNVTDIDQYILGPKFWIAWLFSPNTLRLDGHSLLWTGPGWSRHPKGAFTAIRIEGDATGTQAGKSIGRLTEEGDLGAWNDVQTGTSRADPLQQIEFGNGYLEWDLGVLNPGENTTVTIYTALGAGADPSAASADASSEIAKVRQAGVEEALNRTRASWRGWVDSSRIPREVMSGKEESLFRKSAMALKMNQAVLTGALPELWDMQPMWFMVWPGNGVWHAAALEALGHPEEAERYLDYLASIQAPDGHWRMAYTCLGDYHGVFEIEEYMTPSAIWLAWVHWKSTENHAWLESYWPVVERAADFVISRVARNGLLYASPDYVEDLTAFRQSLFTNGIAVAGLRAASEMAGVLGNGSRSGRYSDAAARIEEAIVRILWDPVENNFRANFDMHGPHGHGTPPVLAWPFHAFDLKDSRLSSMIERSLDAAIETQDFVTFKDSQDWTPGLLMNAAFYFNHFNATGRRRSRDLGQFILDGVTLDRNLTLGGFLAERFFGYGVKGSGKPLIWPHTLYVLAQLSKQGGSPIPLLPLP